MDSAVLELELPEILADIPQKLMPLITDINKYRYFLIEGGRGGAKSQTVGRFLLYLAEKLERLRIVCGREIQNTIQESVYTLLSELIAKNFLYFEVLASKITHRQTNTAFNFRGFREQGAINIQGMEGVDIVWIDEAQAITKRTLDALIPTIRKENAKIFFTMNRFVRNDPVYAFCAGRPDCLHIKINYTDNPKCPQALIIEAEECKRNNETDYNHIWLGEPLDQTEDYLFNFAKLDIAKTLQPFGDLFIPQSVMAVDFAGGGGAMCVASLLKRQSNVHWGIADQRAWSDRDTDLSIGKTIALKSLWLPTLTIVDKGGLGYPMYVSLSKTIKDIQGFDGAGESLQPNAGNQRADGYLVLKDFTDQEWLILSKYDKTIKQLETIKRKYQRSGKVYIQSKEEMRGDGVESPDYADSVMMAVYAIRYLLGKITPDQTGRIQVQRVDKRKQGN